MTHISGTTLLQKAAVLINFELVRVMVQELGADVDGAGQTPISHGAKCKDLLQR